MNRKSSHVSLVFAWLSYNHDSIDGKERNIFYSYTPDQILFYVAKIDNKKVLLTDVWDELYGFKLCTCRFTFWPLNSFFSSDGSIWHFLCFYDSISFCQMLFINKILLWNSYNVKIINFKLLPVLIFKDRWDSYYSAVIELIQEFYLKHSNCNWCI